MSPIVIVSSFVLLMSLVVSALLRAGSAHERLDLIEKRIKAIEDKLKAGA